MDKKDILIHRSDEYLCNISTVVERTPVTPFNIDFLPRFRDMRYIDNKDVYVYERHKHSHYEIIIAQSGVYQCFLNGKKLRMKEHDILVIKPGDTHFDNVRETARFTGVTFFIDCSLYNTPEDPEIFISNCKPELQKITMNPDIYKNIIKRLHAESKIADNVSSHLQDVQVAELFWQVVRLLPQKIFPKWFIAVSEYQSFQQNLQRIFLKNLKTDLLLKDMAKLMGMGKSSFSHKCKNILGTSPLNEFTRFKMNYAKKILNNSNTSIKELAFTMGYSSPYHFSRTFKRIHGISPLHYKDTVLSNSK